MQIKHDPLVGTRIYWSVAETLEALDLFEILAVGYSEVGNEKAALPFIRAIQYILAQDPTLGSKDS